MGEDGSCGAALRAGACSGREGARAASRPMLSSRCLSARLRRSALASASKPVSSRARMVRDTSDGLTARAWRGSRAGGGRRRGPRGEEMAIGAELRASARRSRRRGAGVQRGGPAARLGEGAPDAEAPDGEAGDAEAAVRAEEEGDGLGELALEDGHDDVERGGAGGREGLAGGGGWRVWCG